jgi:tetratricopeptide (TPR) repeat protein
LVSAGVALGLARRRLWGRPPAYCLGGILLVVLATLSWRESRIYAELRTLYDATLARNPDCWIFHNNLAAMLADQGQVDEAVAHYQRALALNPNYAEAHNNLANALMARNRINEAIEHYQRAVEIDPECIAAENSLAGLLTERGRLDEAAAHFRHVLRLKPDYAEAHNNFGVLLADRGQADEAIAHYRTAIEIAPDNVEAHRNLGMVLEGQGKMEEALRCYEQSLRLQSDQPQLLNNVAWIRATHPDPKLRDGARAVAAAEGAVRLLPNDISALDTLAAAYAEGARFPEAVETGRKALELALRQNRQDVAESIRAKLTLYAAGTPFRDTRSGAAPTPASP